MIKNNICKLDLDSPSYPTEYNEYWQCGCRNCIKSILEEFSKILKKKIKHTKECDRWNNHSDGEADFRNSSYICQCIGKEIDIILKEMLRLI